MKIKRKIPWYEKKQSPKQSKNLLDDPPTTTTQARALLKRVFHRLVEGYGKVNADSAAKIAMIRQSLREKK